MTPLLLGIAIQSTNLLADQTWKLGFAIVGKLASTPGSQNPFEFKNPELAGDLVLTHEKPLDTDNELVRLLLKMKRSQNELTAALTGDLPAKSGSEVPEGGLYMDKDFAYFTAQFMMDRKKATAIPYSPKQNVGGDAVLAPLGTGLAIMQRAMMGPELRKESYLANDDSRKFYVTFSPNLNATIDPTKGEAAYKFSLKMVDLGKEYPNFFTGAIRLNTKSKIVQYLRATSKSSDGPTSPQDASFSQVQSVVIGLEAK